MVFWENILAIRQHLKASEFDADTTDIMIEAYECARRELKLPSGHSATTARIADHVLEMAKAGERDPNVICKRVLMQMH